METINLIFPHQLFEESPLSDIEGPVYLVEEFLFFRQYKFHKQKIAFHRASMKFYESFLLDKKKEVHYIEAEEEQSDIRQLIAALPDEIKTINYIDPADDWLERRLLQAGKTAGIKAVRHRSPLFLNSREDLQPFFKASKKKFYQTSWYKQEREKRKILLTKDGEPEGGKWSFDTENRKKYPKDKVPPEVDHPATDNFYEEAIQYVSQHFSDYPGALPDQPLYPYDFEASRKWLKQFLSERFADFGAYEDAIVVGQAILHHSVLTPMLNTGLLIPELVIEKTLQYADENDIPVNSVEGFVRQIIGWREFIRGVYQCKGREERTRNFWQFSRKIPASFYSGDTGIFPVDEVIGKVLKTAYCHHIERLMVLGNFMLLCEFDPDEVYRWFMELFIDAYDWVMVPNVYGMSQFADGGLMSTKPYISGSNYLMKMSDYPKGDWQDTWDALFWRFMNVHRSFFSKNPRLGMLVKNFDKMPEEKQQTLMKNAETYLSQLDQHN